jgi:hypothetical protein
VSPKGHQCAQQRPRDTATTKAPMSPADLAAALNARGVATTRVGSWHAMSVKKTCWTGRRTTKLARDTAPKLGSEARTGASFGT